MDDKIKEVINDNLKVLQQKTKELNKYNVVNVDLNRIIFFLSQFKSADQVVFMIKLILSIELFDSDKITHLLNKAYHQVDENLKVKPLFSALGTIQDSSAIICYRLLKTIFKDEEGSLKHISELTSVGEMTLKDKPSSIIFFDDNITSGTQLEQFFTEWIDGSEKPELVRKPLKKEEFEVVQKTPIRICYAIQLSEKSNEKIEKIRTKYKLDLKILRGKVDYNNYMDYESHTIENPEEGKFARELIRGIAEQLYKDKDWEEDKLYYRLLGYGNLGKLVAFYYNVPKSFVPVFWKFGIVDGKPWLPLLPEIQEKKKIDNNNIEIDFTVIGEVLSYGSIKSDERFPLLHFGFAKHKGNAEVIDYVNQSSLKIQIPSWKALQEKIFSAKPVVHRQPAINPDDYDEMSAMRLFNENGNPDHLIEKDYSNYLKNVAEYNGALTKYFNAVCDYIQRISSTNQIKLLIANQGNIRATQCTVKMHFNTEDIVLGANKGIPIPEFENKVPNIKAFNSKKTFAELIVEKQPPWLGEIFSSEPLEFGESYFIRPFENQLVGQNDNDTKTTEITRMNKAIFKFEISYEMNYHENASTIEGKLNVIFEEVDKIDSKLLNSLLRTFKDLAGVWTY